MARAFVQVVGSPPPLPRRGAAWRVAPLLLLLGSSPRLHWFSPRSAHRRRGKGSRREEDGAGVGVPRRAADAGSGGGRAVADVCARPVRPRHHRALLSRLLLSLKTRRV
ncbi:hypothetical protein BRADI_4g32901v3 [Brachypodium distachyon]|uniref:Uncharacterized protein n=1 Tax=Brachypodium distachyon TaxID=15368 RepID=A0A0Q3IX35_BRADI|nr:hypothetical protein BRADI_4g32901v3 [Brachypodium distachyon]